MAKKISDVAAAIIVRDERYLIAQRKTGHLAGRWEFPGGKLEGKENVAECLIRELREELGVSVRVRDLLCAISYDYGEYGQIQLYPCFCDIVAGRATAEPISHAELRWVRAPELPSYDFAPADVSIVKQLVARVSRK